jgi:hypothetical protein
MDADRFPIGINGSAMDVNCWPTNIFRELEDMHGGAVGYPPDLEEEATKTVLAQAELLCAEWAA